MSAIQIITSTVVPESERMNFVDGLFGISYVLRLEPMIFGVAEILCADYTGGYWEFHQLSNGGFYMAPRGDDRYTVTAENGFESELSAEAFGITVCLYAYSNLCFGKPDGFTETCARQYHWTREFSLEHAEGKAIFAAID